MVWTTWAMLQQRRPPPAVADRVLEPVLIGPVRI
jgi:hypothetical protein